MPTSIFELNQPEFQFLSETQRDSCANAKQECLKVNDWMRSSCTASPGVIPRATEVFKNAISSAGASDGKKLLGLLKVCPPDSPLGLTYPLAILERLSILGDEASRKSAFDSISKTFHSRPVLTRRLEALIETLDQVAAAKIPDFDFARHILLLGSAWTRDPAFTKVPAETAAKWLSHAGRFMPGLGLSHELAKIAETWTIPALVTLNSQYDLPLPAFCVAWRETGNSKRCSEFLKELQGAQKAGASPALEIAVSQDALKRGELAAAYNGFAALRKKLEPTKSPILPYTSLFLAEVEIEQGNLEAALRDIDAYQKATTDHAGLPWEKYGSSVMRVIALRLDGELDEAAKEADKYLDLSSKAAKGAHVVTLWLDTEKLVLALIAKKNTEADTIAAKILKELSSFPSLDYTKATVAALQKGARAQDNAADISALVQRFGERSVEVRYVKRALDQITRRTEPGPR